MREAGKDLADLILGSFPDKKATLGRPSNCVSLYTALLIKVGIALIWEERFNER